MDPPQCLYCIHKYTNRGHTHQTHLYGVGRYSPDKITGEVSLSWSVFWELWEAVPLDDVSLEKMKIDQLN